ncbi:MAG TPA: substrate-binding domain-containing protein [Candidatus Paceibacterota bacterium]|nr:substrate-binding domain-containing protein [Candidatus Paceibacterota bacterium]
MQPLPQKLTLVAQTAAILRNRIRAGEWRKWLPSEHELCAEYRIARMTLRRALQRLEQEGLVRSAQGKRREIEPGAVQVESPPRTRVVLLARVPLQFLPPFDAFWTNELRLVLEETGHHLEVHTNRAYYGPGLARSLAVLHEQLRPAGWVLANSTREMQLWFSRRQLPCVIVGSRHPGVDLPFVDKAYRAICRHAVGLFLSRGHERIALLNPDSGAAGDLESEQGFEEGIAQTRRHNIQGCVVRHDGTVSNLCARLNGLFRRPGAPTALLVSRSMNVLTVMGHLLRSGVRIPEDVALISRDHDSFLERVVPSVARYVVSPETMARAICATVLAMVNNGKVSPAQRQIMPKFTEGETLGPAPPPPAPA